MQEKRLPRQPFFYLDRIWIFQQLQLHQALCQFDEVVVPYCASIN